MLETAITLAIELLFGLVFVASLGDHARWATRSAGIS